MIALYLSWHDRQLENNISQRIVDALRVGNKNSAQFCNLGAAIAVKTKQHKGWRPPQTHNKLTILFDGYIDNRDEIQTQLRLHASDDAHLYAEAYSRWENKADEKIIGNYAVIIFHPSQRIVRLARSPINAPPLHIWNDDDILIVSSTPRAIFASGEIPQILDEQKIADTLFLNYNEEERSWFKDVRRLPTGFNAILRPNESQFNCYYDYKNLPDIRLGSDEEYVEALDLLMKNASRAALKNFSKPAISLSGGYDSQAVAYYALQELGGQPLVGLTGVPEQEWDGKINEGLIGDESNHVRALAEMYPSLETYNIDAKGLYFDHKLNSMFALASCSPRNAANLHWIHEVWSNAKARGCDVILHGSFGNATISFAGDGALPSMLAKGEWSNLLRELRSTQCNNNLLRTLASQAIMPLLPKNIWLAINWLRHGQKNNPFDSWCPMNEAYAADYNVESRAEEMGYNAYFRPPSSTRDCRVNMIGYGMNDASDIMQAFELLHDITERDPTAYRPLVEFCLGIPDNQFLRNGHRRWLARRLLTGKIPDMVLNETRKGQQFADWHLRMGRQVDLLRSEIDSLSNDSQMAYRLNLPSLKKALDQWPAENPTDPQFAQRLSAGVIRGLTTARFIRYIQGQND